MWDGKRMREIFRREGARLSQHYDFRWMRIHSRLRRERQRENDTRLLYKHYEYGIKMLREN